MYTKSQELVETLTVLHAEAAYFSSLALDVGDRTSYMKYLAEQFSYDDALEKIFKAYN